jgi:hypothetical protein
LTLIVCGFLHNANIYLIMENTITITTMAGQICKIVNPLSDENSNDVYIVREDPTPYDLEDSIYVSNLEDLQRNITKPVFTPPISSY